MYTHSPVHTRSFLIITSCELNKWSLRPWGQMCGRWWMRFHWCSSDQNTTAPIITSIENPRIKTFNTYCFKRSLYNVTISHVASFYSVKLWFRLLLLHIQMCRLIICAYCSGSEGWRAVPPHVSAGPVESQQWSCGHPAASSAVPCRSDAGSQPGTTDLPEIQTDLPAELHFLTAATALWRREQMRESLEILD